MGRPRTFEPDDALEAALALFWRKGFDGTSYADLVAATGVERPALYSAFGNKDALFLRALAHYDAHYAGYVQEALQQDTACAVAERFLLGAVALNTRYPDRLGCLGITGALAASDASDVAMQALIDWRARGLAALQARFEKARDEGDLPAHEDSHALASYLLAVAHGVAVQAKAGFSKETLEKVARQALRSWPVAQKKSAS